MMKLTQGLERERIALSAKRTRVRIIIIEESIGKQQDSGEPKNWDRDSVCERVCAIEWESVWEWA